MRFEQITDLAHQISEEFGFSLNEVRYRQKKSFSCLRTYSNHNSLILQRDILHFNHDQISAILYVTFARHMGRTNSTKYFYYSRIIDEIQQQQIHDASKQFAKHSMNTIAGKVYNLQSICAQIVRSFGIIFTPSFIKHLPSIGWSTRSSYRKFGSYYPKINTITLSQSLDSLQVPEYVVNYVLFHELLHACLGTHTKNARQIAHSPEFHRLERLHPEYERANAFLNHYSLLICRNN